MDHFTEIVTNPAEWDESGLLKLRRRVDPTGVQHGCMIGCSANMCKGISPFSMTNPPRLKSFQEKS